MINIIASQGDGHTIYEHFRRHFSTSAGLEYSSSSSESWASTDLSRDMEAAASNAPAFLSALYDAVEALRKSATYDLPEIDDINAICRAERVGFEVHPPEVVPTSTIVLEAISNVAKATNDVLAQLRLADSSPAQPIVGEFPDSFDVAITVARPDRTFARELAQLLQEAGVIVFYDELFPEHLWGENLSDMFDRIFRQRSLFCAMFVSDAYSKRVWTNHERQSALARALKERGNAYILPIRVDETDLPGLPPTVGYVSLRELGISRVAELLIKKVRHARARGA